VLAPLLVTLLTVVGPARLAEPAASPGDDRETAETKTPGAKLEHGYLRVAGHERAPLVDALVLRVPHLRFEPFERAGSESTTAAAFVDIREEAAAPEAEQITFSLTIVVSDGRAFDRRVQTLRDDEETTRLLASTTANLLLAIEAGTVEADRGNVPLPTAPPPVCPQCECPQPPSCPASSEPEPSHPKRPKLPRIELGPVISASSVLGLGAPQQADRFAAAGGTLGVHARLHRGALFGLEVRGAGRRGPVGVGLARLRFGLGAGYRLRRGAWSLGASLWATVEPWRALGGDIEPPPSPLWGLAARLSPGLVQTDLAGGRLALSLAPMIELSTSAALTSEGPRVDLLVVTEQDQERGTLRVGGLELSSGLSVTLWFAPGARD
jgi:hypothetical protein